MMTSLVVEKRKSSPVFRARPDSQVEGREHDGGGLRRFDILTFAVWFGLATGLAESGLIFLRGRLLGAAAIGSLQLSDHYPWMIPLDNLLIFSTCGLALALLSLLLPRLAGRPALFVFVSLAFTILLLTSQGLYLAAALLLSVGAGVRLSRSIRAHLPAFKRLVWLTTPVLILSSFLIFGWTKHTIIHAEQKALAGLPVPDKNAPNVLLLVLDTVRYDRLSMNGYQRPTTPNLARLAQRGVRFENARSTAPWTLPSHASLFTGRWPGKLKVGDENPLDATYPTIAEFLSKRGYLTAGMIGNTFYCNSWYGLNRGFIHYEDDCKNDHSFSLLETARCSSLIRRFAQAIGSPLDPYHLHKNVERIDADFLKWLEVAPLAHRPFFVFLNYIDAHTPYLLPAGRKPRFGRGPQSPAEFQLLMDWDKTPKLDVSAGDVELASDGYDDCIAFLDDQLGLMFDELGRRGILDKTLVVVTSDHGEEMGERLLYGHGKSLYKPELHVPLLIVPPGGLSRPITVPQAVSLRDFPATIAAMVAPGTTSPFPGASLERFWNLKQVNTTSLHSDPILSEVSIRDAVSNKNLRARAPAQRGPMKSILAECFVLIHNADGGEELYHLDRDPQELNNLATDPSSAPLLVKLRIKMQAALDEK